MQSTSPCPNKIQCGSCELSAIPYKDQLNKKLLNINLALSEHSVICTNIIPSPVTQHYRNKMDYPIDFMRKMGLREKGKWWKVIDGHTCFLADKEIERLFFATRDWVKSTPLSCWDRRAFVGLLRYAVMRVTSIGESLLTIVTSRPADDVEKDLIILELKKLSDVSKPTTLVWSVNSSTSDISIGEELTSVVGSGTIIEDINGLKFTLSSNSFFQTNTYTAKLLQTEVLKMAKDSGAQNTLDLYCGSGFFALSLAKNGINCSGIDIVPEAISNAADNARLNNLNVNFVAEKAEDLSWTRSSYDLIIVDPTRAGLHTKVLQALLDNQPKNLIYVSCNYKQFAAELPKLQTKYQVKQTMALDQFPHTPHVELISHLVLK